MSGGHRSQDLPQAAARKGARLRWGCRSYSHQAAEADGDAILPAVAGLPAWSGRDSNSGPLLALNDLALQKGVPRGVRLTRSEIAEISCQMITDAATNKRPCQTGFYRILEAMLILIKMGPGRADKPEVWAKPPPRPRRQRGLTPPRHTPLVWNSHVCVADQKAGGAAAWGMRQRRRVVAALMIPKPAANAGSPRGRPRTTLTLTLSSGSPTTVC